MDIRQLECFVAVAEELHFRKAGRKIGAQPSIVCEIIDKSTLLQFVAHGLGIALAPAWVQSIAPSGVVFVPFEPCDN